MDKFHLRTFSATLIFLLTILACGAPSSAPTAEPVLMETMVAGTFSVATTQTAVSAPPTLTPIVETATPSPEPIKSSLVVQEDGSTVFIDERAGFKVTVPLGWLAVRVGEPEYYDAWTLAVASEPPIQNALTEIESRNPDQYRLFALDVQDGHIWGGFATSINFVWDEGRILTLENDMDLKALAPSPDSVIELRQTASGIPFGVVASKLSAKTADGMDMVVVQKQVYFNLKVGTLMITFSTPESLNEITTPSFDALIETVIVLD